MLKHWDKIALAVATALTGCAQKPSITEADVTDVLSKAVLAAAKKMPPTFCLDPQLKPSAVVWADKVDSDGWATQPNTANFKYRRISSPDASSIPSSAMGAFPAVSTAGECHHKLEFHKPEFVEVKESGESYIETAVFFEDPCPTCGAGYAIELIRRPGKPWEITAPGVEQLWVS